MQIRMYEDISQKPNGDRDNIRHACFGYRVVLVNGDNRVTFFENNQFNLHSTSIMGTRQSHLQEAINKVEELIKVLGTVEVVGIEYTRQEKRMMDLEESIKRDQAELDEIKRRVL